MKAATLLALGAGLALLTALLAWQGAATIAETLAVAGWKLLWLGPLYLLPLGLAAQSWRLLFAAGEGPAAAAALRLSWIGLAVNWLLPVAQVGGEAVRARLLTKQGSPGSLAVASVVVDKTVQALCVPLFALVGLGLFLARHGGSKALGGALVVMAVLGAATLAFYRVQRAGLFGIAAKIIDRLVPWRLAADLRLSAETFDAAIHAVYQRRGRFIIACLWRLLFLLALSAELWIILFLLGHPVSVAEAVILESLGTVVMAAAFAVPGALGVQEGGFMVLAAALGIGAEVGLTMSLCLRVRELMVGLPGLIAWQIGEGRALVRGRARR